jgi:hypothetical protein
MQMFFMTVSGPMLCPALILFLELPVTYGSDFLDPSDYSGLGITWTIIPPMAVDASGWLFLSPTNLYDSYPASEAAWEVAPVSTIQTAPPGTARVRFQIEFDNSSFSGGAVYFDDCDLEKLNYTDPDITNPPVAVTTLCRLAGVVHRG